MALTHEDLQAIEQLLDRKLEEKLEAKLEEKLEVKLEEKLEAKLEEKLEVKLEEKLGPIREELAEIKEHAEVTRSATNSLVEWADTVGVITQVKFPIKKAQGG